MFKQQKIQQQHQVVTENVKKPFVYVMGARIEGEGGKYSDIAEIKKFCEQNGQPFILIPEENEDGTPTVSPEELTKNVYENTLKKYFGKGGKYEGSEYSLSFQNHSGIQFIGENSISSVTMGNESKFASATLSELVSIAFKYSKVTNIINGGCESSSGVYDVGTAIEKYNQEHPENKINRKIEYSAASLYYRGSKLHDGKELVNNFINMCVAGVEFNAENIEKFYLANCLSDFSGYAHKTFYPNENLDKEGISYQDYDKKLEYLFEYYKTNKEDFKDFLEVFRNSKENILYNDVIKDGDIILEKKKVISDEDIEKIYKLFENNDLKSFKINTEENLKLYGKLLYFADNVYDRIQGKSHENNEYVSLSSINNFSTLLHYSVASLFKEDKIPRTSHEIISYSDIEFFVKNYSILHIGQHKEALQDNIFSTLRHLKEEGLINDEEMKKLFKVGVESMEYKADFVELIKKLEPTLSKSEIKESVNNFINNCNKVNFNNCDNYEFLKNFKDIKEYLDEPSKKLIIDHITKSINSNQSELFHNIRDNKINFQELDKEYQEAIIKELLNQKYFHKDSKNFIHNDLNEFSNKFGYENTKLLLEKSLKKSNGNIDYYQLFNSLEIKDNLFNFLKESDAKNFLKNLAKENPKEFFSKDFKGLINKMEKSYGKEEPKNILKQLINEVIEESPDNKKAENKKIINDFLSEIKMTDLRVGYKNVNDKDFNIYPEDFSRYVLNLVKNENLEITNQHFFKLKNKSIEIEI